MKKHQLKLLWKTLNKNNYSTNLGGDLLLANNNSPKNRTDATREQEEQVIYIDLHVLKNSKTRRKNPAMARINYKLAYDIVSQIWMIDCLKIDKVYDSHSLLRKPWKTGE